MKIATQCVCARSRPLTVALSPRQTMNYAAALDDGNPWYFQDDRPEGIVAPPMVAVALTWHLSADFAAHWPEVGIPPEVQAQQVHYNESIVWARPLQCDEQLTIQGTIQAIRPHPAGTLMVICYEAVDRAGQSVFTEHITGLLRGVGLEGDGEGAGALPAWGQSTGLTTGLWQEVLRIDPLAAHRYDGCTDIVFPIHTSFAFARNAGLPGPIYQGTALLGLAVKEIVNREGAGDPRGLAAVQAGFRGMVFPGTSALLRVLGTRLENRMKTVYFEVDAPEGGRAIRDGHVTFRVPV